MRKYFTWIPNFITTLNLICGCLAIVSAFNQLLHVAAILIFIASVFDFLDGMSARALKAYTQIGKQLDSLADLISFGLAPAIIIFQVLSDFANSAEFPVDNVHITGFFPYIAFIIVVFSALRLAKFNIDERQTSSFIGLPTPANALFIASIILLHEYRGLNINLFLLTGVVVFMAFLLVAELPMFSLKFTNLKIKGNETRFLFLGLSLLLLIVLKIYALPAIILLYIVLSIILIFVKHLKQSKL